MHIRSLLLNNGIVPIMTEYTRNDVKNITDKNEYKLVMEYGVAFKELDCSKHDKEIYNKALDDCLKIVEWDGYTLDIKRRIEQLKTGGKNES